MVVILELIVGQVITVKKKRYEILRVDLYNEVIVCVEFNSSDRKLHIFSIEEVERENGC
ncbi:Conserved hypothetical protein [Clostridium neonatale]|uniref:hypothetical protein n=1 Tax=Clostridium neonatale TaxID=137838 RepID=UPI001E78810A|nr:hypothetical protein [Clostridium neonatale]CAH0438227.1 Conserved hypothetical protein [Clostridium neonatale]CAI3670534.1 Conserved hypothetical protein [Clostridium neonatale]CAI3729877.1 Conserved hypothetical protein [Clostridium neonatale]DAQ89339.1 MAG TPA: hypothetical protein [Caudoviricetes sp.]